MSDIKVGQRIKDNDPRMHRVLTITDVGERYVWAVYAARTSRIRRDRIYFDSKPRRAGFSMLLSPLPSEVELRKDMEE